MHDDGCAYLRRDRADERHLVHVHCEGDERCGYLDRELGIGWSRPDRCADSAENRYGHCEYEDACSDGEVEYANVDGWRVDRRLHRDPLQRANGRHRGDNMHDECSRPDVAGNDVRDASGRGWYLLRRRNGNECEWFRLTRIDAANEDRGLARSDQRVECGNTKDGCSMPSQQRRCRVRLPY